MARRVIIVCNALDDTTRLRRGVVTDSPAASRKVFMLCQALRHASVRPVVLSLGRGRQDGSGRYFSAAARRVGGVPIVYAPLWQRPLLSQLLSLLAPAMLLRRLRRPGDDHVVVFYNRMPAYAAALLMAPLLRLRAVLDLEDGEVGTGALARIRSKLFDRMCSGGALLACRALEQATAVRPVACYYGTVEAARDARAWPDEPLAVLMGGTVSPDTGAHLLVSAIEQIRAEAPDWARGLEIAVTGKGESIEALQRLAAQAGWPRVVVHGRTTDAQYRAIVQSAQVGLALKPRSGALANTTFPSKVVELAGAGLLVLTTDISDVRSLFGTGAVYLEDESAAGLVDRLRWIVHNRAEAQDAARRATLRVREQCDPALAGQSLARFLFPVTR